MNATSSAVNRTRLVTLVTPSDKTFNLQLSSKEDVLGQGRQTMVRHNGLLIAEVIELGGLFTVAGVSGSPENFTYTGKKVTCIANNEKAALTNFCAKYL